MEVYVGGSVIVILGIRSGTSLLSSMLIKLGVDMGRELQGPSEFNEKGHFEDMEIRALTRKLLKDCKGDMWERIPDTNALRKVFKQIKLTTIKKQREEPWGFKNPESLYVMELYDPILKPKYILCTRNIDSVAKSLEKQNGKYHNIDFKDYAENYFNRAKEFLKDKEHIEVVYEDLLQHPVKNLLEIVDFIKVKTIKGDILNAVKLIDLSLKHE